MPLLEALSGWVGSAHAVAGPEAAETKKALEAKTKEVEALREQARMLLGTGFAAMHTMCMQRLGCRACLLQAVMLTWCPNRRWAFFVLSQSHECI